MSDRRATIASHPFDCYAVWFGILRRGSSKSQGMTGYMTINIAREAADRAPLEYT